MRNTNRETECSVKTLTTKYPKRKNFLLFNLNLLSLDGLICRKMSRVLMTHCIHIGSKSSNVIKNLKHRSHLQGESLPCVTQASVCLLTPNDYPYLQFLMEIRTAPNPFLSPQAIRIPLGWVLKGQSCGTSTQFVD